MRSLVIEKHINTYSFYLFNMIKCRACLKDEGCMVPFSDQHINNFNLLTNLNVQLCDNLPQHLCLCCIEIMKSFIEFREKCILSNYVLAESSKSKPKIENNLITEDKSDVTENVENKTIKVEFTLDIIDELFEDDTIDQNEHADYDLLNDLIKTEDKTEIKIEVEKKSTKSSRNIAVKRKEIILSCGLCRETFPETSLLTAHLSLHKTTNKCDLCALKFPEWPALFSHRLVHLTNREKRCHICLKKFYKEVHLEYHYRKFHCEDKLQSYVATCQDCSQTFETPRKLQKHIWSSHSDKTFLCEHCPKVFKSKKSIKTHMSVHAAGLRLACDLCEYRCKFSSNLKDHKLRKHTPKKANCKKCTRVFSSQEKLEKHNCGEKGTICPICGKIGKSHRQMIRHMTCHDSTARFKCPRCPKAYRSKSALTTHGLIHDGVRSKRCDFCDAAFYSASVLIKHRRTHTGEKPYVCRVCSKGFTGNHNLKVHMKVHGEFLIEKKKTNDVTDLDNKLT